MRDVGATNGFIRAPFVVEGMIIGALGAILPITFTVFGYIMLYHQLDGVLFSQLFELVPPRSVCAVAVADSAGHRYRCRADRKLYVGNKISEVEAMKKMMVWLLSGLMVMGSLVPVWAEGEDQEEYYMELCSRSDLSDAQKAECQDYITQQNAQLQKELSEIAAKRKELETNLAKVGEEIKNYDSQISTLNGQISTLNTADQRKGSVHCVIGRADCRQGSGSGRAAAEGGRTVGPFPADAA